jgi:uncharacterized membrane protein
MYFLGGELMSISPAEYAIVVIVLHTFLLSTLGLLVFGWLRRRFLLSKFLLEDEEVLRSQALAGLHLVHFTYVRPTLSYRTRG